MGRQGKNLRWGKRGKRRWKRVSSKIYRRKWTEMESCNGRKFIFGRFMTFYFLERRYVTMKDIMILSCSNFANAKRQEIIVVPVLTPFPYIASHIINAQFVNKYFTHKIYICFSGFAGILLDVFYKGLSRGSSLASPFSPY